MVCLTLGLACLTMQVEIDPIPHVLIVLRASTDSSKAAVNGSPTMRTLPAELASASVHIPEDQVPIPPIAVHALPIRSSRCGL